MIEYAAVQTDYLMRGKEFNPLIFYRTFLRIHFITNFTSDNILHKKSTAWVSNMSSFTKKKKVCFWSCVAPQVFVHVGGNNSVNCMAFILFIGHYYSYVSAFGELYGLRRSPQCQRYKSTSSSCCQLLAQHPALPLVKT